MATPHLSVVETDTDTKPKTITLPEVGRVVKMAVWKTPDGVYHESLDTVRETLTRQVISDFAILNDIKDMDEMAAALAQHLPQLRDRVETGLKRMTD